MPDGISSNPPYSRPAEQPSVARHGGGGRMRGSYRPRLYVRKGTRDARSVGRHQHAGHIQGAKPLRHISGRRLRVLRNGHIQLLARCHIQQPTVL